MQINRYKIIKKISSGSQGIVYLVEYKKKKYALKKEKILEKNIKKSLKSDFWKEIDFVTKFVPKYPLFFMKLYNYDIINNYNFKLANPYKSDYISKLNKSSYCSRKIYEYVYTTLDKIIDKLKLHELYSILIQLSYAIYAMLKNGYSHNDLHLANIGINKTKKKYFLIFNKKIPTYNYNIKILDYGLIHHSKYKYNSDSLFNMKYLFDKNLDIRCLINIIFTIPFYKKVNIKFWESYDYNQDLNKFLNSKNLILVNNLINDKHDKYLLFKLLYPEIYQKNFLKLKFKRVVNNILRLPIDDIIFLLNSTHIKSYKDIKKIINYFIFKLIN